ncbi:MAG: flagellar biosynthetic protein FliR [Campylobacterales bacterium]|nr:flagellar biosynthetic protein FliR [Campylobacterales bacterium]
MNQLLPFVAQDSVVTFMLLFVRFSSLFAFMPFFSHSSIPMTIKAAIALYFTILFYTVAPAVHMDMTVNNIFLAILSEATFGFMAGFLISTLFGAVGFAGEQISNVMGFSMASMYDPQTQQSSQLISSFLNFFVLLILLASDGHHLMIKYIEYSVEKTPLGGFVLTKGYIEYSIVVVKNIFLIGFMIAFPIMALSLLSDIIFGMIMKTMPSFNLLVVGMPIKVILGLAVLMAVLSSIALIFKERFIEIINHLLLLL